MRKASDPVLAILSWEVKDPYRGITRFVKHNGVIHEFRHYRDSDTIWLDGIGYLMGVEALLKAVYGNKPEKLVTLLAPIGAGDE